MRGASGVKLFWGALAVAALIGLVVLASLVWLVVRYRNSADYPGSEVVAGQEIYSLWPNPTVRRDTSYRTADAFPAVYNFYSNGFSLGPELFAQSNCIQMARSFTDFRVLVRHMSVMVCDTPRGRLIFVMRSLTLRLSRN